MHSHLAIIGTNGELTLKPDTSLTVTDKNPMFNDVEMFTQTIPLPFDLNRRVLKNMDDVNSTMRSADVQGERFQFVLDGIPFRNTAIKIQDGTKLDGTIDVNFDATNRTFKDMIADMRCRDVAVDDDILIGEKIGDVEVEMHITEIDRVLFDYDHAAMKIYRPTIDITETFQPNALGFSFPGHCYMDSVSKATPDPDRPEKNYQNPNVTVKVPKVETSYINVSQPYPAKKYCNSRICYAHHAAEYKSDEKVWESSNDIVQANKRQVSIEEDKSPYWVLPADRPASGICFYVAYFLERLFKTLGVAYDMTALTDISDFNYLCFFNTACHYEAKEATSFNATLDSEKKINEWLSSRGCGGQLRVQNTDPEETLEYWNNKQAHRFQLSSSEYTRQEFVTDAPNKGSIASIANQDGSIDEWFGKGHYTNTGYGYVVINVGRGFEVSYTATAKVMQMFANSDNFPDVNVSEVIESLENSFGVRFIYDAEINKVTVRLLRDMFRNQQAPIPFKGIVTKMVKVNEDIRGIRMKYAAEQDAQEQRDNIRYQKRDYDTNYDYCDYPQGRTQFAGYADVTQKIDVGNRTGYCDIQTGDFFRIKVSSEASSTDEMKPAVFEVGALRGVELGDCSEEADRDNAIKEFVSNFEPILVNDVAYVGKNYDMAEYKPMLVPLIDEDMQHEFITGKILNPVSTAWGSIDIVYELCMAESYDPSSTDDGQSPLQSHEWGLTVGFLRPGNGGDAVVNYEANYDGFGNEKWRIESDDYAVTTDSYDVLGRFLGTDSAGSFSLKPRAWKPFRYKYDDSTLLISTDPKQWEEEDGWLIPCVEDERDQQGNITARIRSRGMCDTWMIEFFRFLLERQKYYVEALCTAAELADIPNKWLRRWEIDGKVGWINMMTYPIDVEKGLGKVEMEFFVL